MSDTKELHFNFNWNCFQEKCWCKKYFQNWTLRDAFRGTKWTWRKGVTNIYDCLSCYRNPVSGPRMELAYTYNAYVLKVDFFHGFFDVQIELHLVLQSSFLHRFPECTNMVGMRRRRFCSANRILFRTGTFEACAFLRYWCNLEVPSQLKIRL